MKLKFWIRGRRLWRARAARHVTRYSWSRGVTAIVHHTADSGPQKNTRRSERAFMRSIQAFHMGPSRQWSDIAYNYMIMPSGIVYEARGLNVVGAHAPGYNARGIGICFAGTFTDREPTPAAVNAYQQLLKRLRVHGARIHDERAHGDVTATSCPGRGIRRALDL